LPRVAARRLLPAALRALVLPLSLAEPDAAPR